MKQGRIHARALFSTATDCIFMHMHINPEIEIGTYLAYADDTAFIVQSASVFRMYGMCHTGGYIEEVRRGERGGDRFPPSHRMREDPSR